MNILSIKTLTLFPLLSFLITGCDIDKMLLNPDTKYIRDMPRVQIPQTKIEVDKNSLTGKGNVLFVVKNSDPNKNDDVRKASINCGNKTVQITSVWMRDEIEGYWKDVNQSPKTPTKDEMKMIEFICRS